MSKEKFKMKDSCKKGAHEWIVSKWYTKGYQNNAVEFSCKFCLLSADVHEKNLQSVAALEAQPEKI